VIKALLIGDEPELASLVGSITTLDRNQTVAWSFVHEPEWNGAAPTVDVIIVDERIWTRAVRSQLQRLCARVGATPIVLLCEPQTALLGSDVLGLPAAQLIDPRHTHQLFQPFKRLNPGVMRGSGLGLALCKKIIDNHQGRVWVESILGQGTTVCFSVPALSPHTDPHPFGVQRRACAALASRSCRRCATSDTTRTPR
jgi:hypothetical protein